MTGRAGRLLAMGLAMLGAGAIAAPYIATAPDEDAQLAAMVDLYDSVCLRAFPDDAAVARAMTARGAAPLDAAGLRDTLHDDPGVGWTLRAAGALFTVTVEAPPFHACAVRTMTRAGFPDRRAYDRLAAAYRRGHPGFSRPETMKGMAGTIDSTLTSEGREIPGGGETLIVASGKVTDPVLRKAGQTAIEVRFVHQIVVDLPARSPAT
ncbi:MAG: hypothetical protein ABW173_01740 [Sphingomonas sp.]